MIVLEIFLTTIGLGLLIELFFSPRIDTTKEGDTLLWYSTKYGRDYLFLFKKKTS